MRPLPDSRKNSAPEVSWPRVSPLIQDTTASTWLSASGEAGSIQSSALKPPWPAWAGSRVTT